MTVESQSFGPDVQAARVKPTKMMKMKSSVGHGSKLIVLNVKLDRSSDPLRALIDTGASSNFVREDALTRSKGIASAVKEMGKMIVRFADGSAIEQVKRVVTLRLECEVFRGEDEFILLDLDDKYDLILGMPWLMRYQPKIDWKRRRISVQGSNTVQWQAANEEQVLWVTTSVEEIANSSGDLLASDGPTRSQSEFVESSDEERVSSQVKKLQPKLEEVSMSESVQLTCRDPSSDRGSGATHTPEQGMHASTTITDEGCIKRDDASGERYVQTLAYDYLGKAQCVHKLKVQDPPCSLSRVLSLEEMSEKKFLRDLKAGEITQVCMIVAEADHEEINTSSNMDFEVLEEKTRIERYEAQSWEALKGNPVYKLALEFKDVFPDTVPEELPPDRGVQHEIDLTPGTKYCVTRQWPLPKEQVEAIDEFFEKRRKAGHVRESKSPHCSPTFCVKKATGGWRIVHAFNKLNDATIPAQTPVPRKDMILDGMVNSTVFSTLDLMDGFYQIRMRDKDVPLAAVSTPSGMLWEWLVMPQGLKNAPATFNRMVTNILRPLRDFAPSYFDDIFVHSKASGDYTDLEVHLKHLRKLFEVMRENQLYANLKKCIFCAPEIPILGCFVGKNGVRADPEKVKAINDWPTPQNVKQLRQWLGLANYLHKYTRNYAEMVQPMTRLLKKDIEWKWEQQQQDAFESVKRSLREAPVLALPDDSKPFHVVCDASDFAIGCALMQHDSNDDERVISYQSRQLKPAERNYPVHDKELLAMKYALVKFRVHLLGEERFVIYTDHASLRTAVKTPHLSQRMARWISFFAEYNFVVHYKPGRTNILADALSRRPDYDTRSSEDASTAACRSCSSNQETVSAVAVRASSSVQEDIKRAYKDDEGCSEMLRYLDDPSDEKLQKLSPRVRSRIHRHSVHEGLLRYGVDDGELPRIVVPNNEEIRHRLLFDYHDSPPGGHLGREKTFLSLSRDYYWPHMYKWVRKYVRTCEVCQRVKPSSSTQAPLRSLPVPIDSWKSVSMDFVFGLPADSQGRNGVLVIVDRFSKMVHLTPVRDTIDAEQTAQVFVDTVFRLHGLPEEIVSDRDPRFTSVLWRTVFERLGTKLSMSTASHPETDGQTERVNRVIKDILRSYATSFEQWSDFLPLVEFSINNSTHASTGYSPFFINCGFHPRVPATLSGIDSTLGGGGTPTHAELNTASGTAANANFDALVPKTKMSRRDQTQILGFVNKRQAIVRFVRDAIAQAQDQQKEQADKHGRRNMFKFKVGDLVLLNATDLPEHAVSNLGSRKLLPRFIGPFKILKCNGDAYTIDIPTSMRLHPTFYVGRLKPYLPSGSADPTASAEGDSPDVGELRPGREVDVTPRIEVYSRHRDAEGRRRTGPSPTLVARDELQTRHEERQGSSQHPRQHQGVGRDSSHEPSPASGVRECRHDTVEAATRTRTSTKKSEQWKTARQRGRRRTLHSELQEPRNESSDRSNADAAPRSGHDERSSTSRAARSFLRSAPPPLIDSHGDRRWLVESIVDHRDDPTPTTHRRKKQTNRFFRVRWRGYPPSEDTWEHRESLAADVPDIVRDYESRM